MGNLIYIMGKSSTGKDTIYRELKQRIDTNIYVPYTTRPMRTNEENGRDYNFITKEEFYELEKQNKIMENRKYNVINAEGKKDIWIYTTVDDNQWKRDGDFLSVGTLESYVSIQKYLSAHPERNLKLLPVYISIDEEERWTRAVLRERKQEKPNYEEMDRRIAADNIDFSDEKLEQAGITKKQTFYNYDLDECVDKIVDYIKENTKESANNKQKDDDFDGRD